MAPYRERSVDSDSDSLDSEGPRKKRRLSQSDEDNDDPPPAKSQDSDASEHEADDIAKPRISISVPSRISRMATKIEKNDGPPLELPLPGVKVATDDTLDFKALGLDKWQVNSLANMAITHPTGIQAACIPEILAGRDCIGGSRTGSGKTVAFAAPMLHQWAKDPSGIFAVVLTPTRELALQIYEQFRAISAPVGLKPLLVTGGADMRAQALALAAKPHVVIATPGRLADHVRNSGPETIAGLRRVRYVVLDEADRLLSSFAGPGSMLPDIEACLDVLPQPSRRQTLLFTATVTPEVRALKDRPTPPGRQPLFISEIDVGALAIPATLRQTYLLVNVLHKEKYLHVLLSTPANLSLSTIIFANRTATATLLEHTLRLLGHRVTSLHSGLHHRDRTDNLARFRAAAARILVATDVAARGLDIPDVGLVINYDLPRDSDDYIHRVGRTARAGRIGTSVSLVGQRDVELVKAIEARVGAEMEAYAEEGVNVETRVVRDALGVVAEKKREALLRIEEGRDVKGRRVGGARAKFRGVKRK